MTDRKANTGSALEGCQLPGIKCLSVIFLFFSLGISVTVFPQNLPEYDEIPVFVEIPRYGGTEIDAAIRGTELFLPVASLFDFLKIRNLPSQDFESISGFFIEEQAEYLISRTENKIVYQGKTFNLESGDLIRTENNLYLRSSYFGKVFGLECKFNFRSLSVTLESKLELPLIREMRLDEMRKNLTRLKGEMRADTSVGRTYPFFKFGMADWSAISTQEINGTAETRLNLALGAMLAGGEASASLYYNSDQKFSEKQQQYLWRYVNNDFKPLRQVMAGKFATHATSTIYNPVIGIQLTNTPTTYRRSFGSYTLSDRTEPGWIVELYVNNELVDYVTADASGFFKFEVPLVYGNSMVKLKFYGPWGEERTREQNIIIPFNFLPYKTFEYNLGAGIVEDSLKSRFSRASLNYGLTRGITVGGGVEYLSSVTSGHFMPYVNASVRLSGNFLLSGDFTYGVRARGTLTYRLPSNVQLELNYTWYDRNQTAINYNYREERKASVAVPLRIGKFSSYNRFSAYQIVLPSTQYTTGEWLFSGSLFGISTNLTTYGLFLEHARPYFYSNLSLAMRLPAGFIFMPQAQYSYTLNQLLSARVRVEKHLMDHAHMYMSYEQNFRNNIKMGEAGIRYDFSFAQAGMSVRQTNKRTSFVEYARGSIINDSKTKYIGADNRTNVGRGGITVIAFIDSNNNGRKDQNEPKLPGLNLRASGGRVVKNDKDTTIRILSLEPYTNCFLELDPNSFENISWRLPYETISVAVDPNILKTVEIPVKVEGEASGTVFIEREGEKKGLGRIIMEFLTTDFKQVGKTLTENDGYYSYLGLLPGNFIVRADTSQLRKLGLRSDPPLISFNVKPGTEGDIIDNLDFTLIPVKPVAIAPEVSPVPQEEPVIQAVIEKPAVQKDTTYTVIHEITEKTYTISEDSWAIQIGAFKSRAYAERFRSMLKKALNKDVQITVAGDYYRVRILDLHTRAEVDENVVRLNKLGFKELWIIRLLAMQQQTLLISREDSLARISVTVTDTAKTIKEEVGRAVTDTIPASELTIQVGAFRQENNALVLREHLASRIDKPVSIVHEDGYFKVRITGFETAEELLKYIPILNLLGQRDIWILPFRRREEPAVIPPVAIAPDTSRIPVEKAEVPVIEEKPPAPEPTVALQVAIFYRKSQALRAQKRITSKLGLPVEIVEQWGYYHVIVTGFFTREETYRFYPELAALGYPGVTLIENYRSPK